MKLIEVTNPNFVVNKEFEIVFDDGTRVTYYEDDYIDLQVREGKMIINGKFVTDSPENFDDFVEPVDPSSTRLEESTIELSTLSPVVIKLPTA